MRPRVRLEDFGLQAGHRLLSGRDVRVSTGFPSGRHRAGNSRAERARLGGAGDLHGPARHVRVNLHHKRVLLCDSAAVDHLARLHAVGLEAVDDRQRPECRRLDQGPVDLTRRRVQRLAQQQARQALVYQDRPVAVVPVQSQQAGLARPQPPRLLCQRLVAARLRPARANVVHEPVEDVADSRLPRLQAYHARHHAARHDSAQARNVRKRPARRMHHHVARAGADDLDEGARRDARADGPQMRVERAHSHGNARNKPRPLRPRRGQATDGLVDRVGLVPQPAAQPGHAGVQPAQEPRVGIAAPPVVVHGLVTGGTHADGQVLRRLGAGKGSRNPVGHLHPRVGGIEHLGACPQAVQDLAEEPLAAVYPAALGQILRAHLPGQFRDLLRLGHARVVLPQPGHGGWITGETLVKGEWPAG